MVARGLTPTLCQIAGCRVGENPRVSSRRPPEGWFPLVVKTKPPCTWPRSSICHRSRIVVEGRDQVLQFPGCRGWAVHHSARGYRQNSAEQCHQGCSRTSKPRGWYANDRLSGIEPLTEVIGHFLPMCRPSGFERTGRAGQGGWGRWGRRFGIGHVIIGADPFDHRGSPKDKWRASV